MMDILALCNKLLDDPNVSSAQKDMVLKFAMIAMQEALTKFNANDASWYCAMQ